ncbi:hypothetical protein NC651_031941 [Populus alba x Populus x berolinensis]|nr:hypothetical protein NC651_031941 [Populus alba x Populus x berolinensis]
MQQQHEELILKKSRKKVVIAFAAAGAAVLSAVIVNPLDVAKVASSGSRSSLPRSLSSGTACFESNTAPAESIICGIVSQERSDLNRASQFTSNLN